MSITMQPSAKITFCHVPFESDGKHNLYFKPTQQKTSAQLRDEYFAALTSDYDVYDFTYIRKDSSIKVNLNYELMQRFNYCYYVNYTSSGNPATITDQGFSTTSRKVFCYITALEYVNENCTKVYIKTDVWNTFITEICGDTSSQSYIERMHVSDDSIGKNLVPEGLETGEYIPNQELTHSTINPTANIPWTDGATPESTGTTRLDLGGMIMVGTTSIIGTVGGSGQVKSIGKSFSGLYYVGFAQVEDAIAYLNYADSLGKGDAVYTIFMCPASMCGATKWLRQQWVYNGGHECFVLQNSALPTSIQELTVSVATANTFKSTTSNTTYTPKNKKLYTGDYNYIMATDHNGHCGTYNYEYFSSQTSIKFDVKGVMSQGCSITMIPKNYKKLADNYNEMLNFVKLPTCAWTTDTYTNWLTQTAVSRETDLNYIKDKNLLISSATNGVNWGEALRAGLIGGAIGVGGSGAMFSQSEISSTSTTKNIGSTAANNILGITDYQKKIDDINNVVYEHSLIPPKASNANATVDVNYALGICDFYLYAMQITAENAKRIDDYFTRYGYKVLESTNIVPIFSTRNVWNYIKCVECNIHSDSIPDEYTEEIKALFTNGITLWHDASKIYHYNETNAIS